MRINRRLSVAVLVLLGALALSASGQTTGGAVTGQVVDAQGAVIPNATVKLTDKAKGQTLTTQTTEAGSYNFPNVAVGDYSISFENAGFAPAAQEVRVSLNQVTTVNATLQAAGVAESVQVTAASEALVQTDTSQLNTSFDNRQVLDLPVFNNPTQLAVLAPNVVERSAGVLGAGGSVGGARPRGNSFTVDGVDNNDAVVTIPVIGVIQDTVQQFTLLANNYSAEFGAGGAGGQFNTVTRTGTNDFHGAGWLYAQSERFNALSTAVEDQVQSGQLDRAPRFRDNRYGGMLGGPVLKNKLFFFGAFEREKNTGAGGAYQFFAPTSGGLDQIAGLPGASAYVVNLIRNNAALAPAAEFRKPVLTTLTDAQCATAVSPNCVPFGTVTVISPNGFGSKQFQINIDHEPDARNQFRYRYNDYRLSQEQVGGSQGGALAKFNNNLLFNAKLFSATWVRTFNANVVNDLRLAYRRHSQDYVIKDASVSDFPNILDAVETGIDIGPNGTLPQGTPVDNNYQLFDTVSYIRGAHSFKFGGEFRVLILRSLFLPRARGDYFYSSFDELISDSFPSFVALRGVGNPEFVGNQKSYFGFAQDDWKVRPNLTLNLGLRYEYETLPRDSKLQARNSVSDVPGVITFGLPKTDKNNFAPRVGLVYSPNGNGRLGRLLFGAQGQSSLRANFSVSYYYNFQNLAELEPPPQVQSEINLNLATAVFGFDPNRPFLQNGGFPSTLPPANTPAAARALTANRLANQINPYSLAWTLSYQRELSPSMALELRYLSTRGRHLPVQVRLNSGLVPPALNIPTFFSRPTSAQLAALTTTLGQLAAQRQLALGRYGFAGNITEFEPEGNSQYDSGALSLTRRFTRGFAFTAAYTWSKSIDDSTNELNSSTVNPRRAQDAFDMRAERGLSALDVPHRLAASLNYDVPFFNGSRNRFLRTALGGFQVNAIFSAQSGQPITPLSGRDSNLNFDSAGDRTIVNLNGVAGTGTSVTALNAAGEPVALGSNSTVAYLADDPSAQYVQAGPGARANGGRNTLRTRGGSRTDAVFIKNFRFGERYNLQVGAEFFDLFNQRPKTVNATSFGPGGAVNPNGGLEVNGEFATVSSGAFNNYALGDFPGRSAVLRAKFIF
jgi:outer membrane receptor protein involved in Fe transport